MIVYTVEESELSAVELFISYGYETSFVSSTVVSVSGSVVSPPVSPPQDVMSIDAMIASVRIRITVAVFIVFAPFNKYYILL